MENSKIKQNGLEIKLIENLEELEAALALTFTVYVTEKEYLNPNQLDKKQLKRKMLWDKYDFSPSTTQIIAKSKNQLVGRVRLIDNNTPLEEEFDFREYGISNIRESSRLVVDPNHRHSLKIILGFMNLIYNLSKSKGEIFCSSFEEGKHFYEGLGGEVIGEFENKTFQGNPNSYVFKWDFRSLPTTYMNNPDIKKSFVSRMIQPLNLN